jgi:hypothetical protein
VRTHNIEVQNVVAVYKIADKFLRFVIAVVRIAGLVVVVELAPVELAGQRAAPGSCPDCV